MLLNVMGRANTSLSEEVPPAHANHLDKLANFCADSAEKEKNTQQNNPAFSPSLTLDEMFSLCLKPKNKVEPGLK